ncbi:MAG: hypothetical protein ACE5IK_12285 [Acidobacteriota bacterium]
MPRQTWAIFVSVLAALAVATPIPATGATPGPSEGNAMSSAPTIPEPHDAAGVPASDSRWTRAAVLAEIDGDRRLRDAFNADQGKVRLLMILSPT